MLVSYLDKNKDIITKYDNYVQNVNDKKNAEHTLEILNKDLEICKGKIEMLEKKREELFVMKNNYLKYVESNNVKTNILKLEDEIDEINKSVCNAVIDYENLSKELLDINNLIGNIEISIEKNKIEIEKKNHDKKIYNANKELFFDLQKLKNNKEEIEKNYDVKKREYSEITQKITFINNKLKKSQDDLLNLKYKNNVFLDLFNNMTLAEKKKDNYVILNQLLKNDGGIIDILMVKNILPKLNEIVNALLYQFGEKEIKITYVDSKIGIEDESGVDIIKDGGYKSYLNNLIYRIALSQLNAHMSTDFMIIDEVCDSADIDNKENIKKLIDYLKLINKWTLIISHDEDIKDKFEKRFIIKKNKQIQKYHKIELL